MGDFICTHTYVYACNHYTYIYNGFDIKALLHIIWYLFSNFQKDKPDPKPLVVKEIPRI